MANQYLKPCPFCGGAATLESTGGRHYVWCVQCDADGPWEVTEEDAAGCWNKRTADEPSEAEALLREARWSIDDQPLRYRVHDYFAKRATEETSDG